MESLPRVLLVDDVEANLVALEAQLSKLSCELVRARSGNEALRLLLQREFAMMLLDVQMPGMDGYEVARYVRQNPDTQELPIIFMTAMDGSEENTLRGYSAGAVDFLFKPINPDILFGKVRVFLELYRSRLKLANEVEAHKATVAELEAFNYSVSHDLRAPLRPLAGFSQVLLQNYGDVLDTKAKDYLNRIRAAAQRMSQLIEDLLQLSRMGRSTLTTTSLDLVPISDSIVSELRQADPERHVEYRTAPEAKAEGDPHLLRIALENLLRNAWKFTQGVDRAVIEFGTREEGEQLICYVRDNGAGFDPAYTNKLFQPFARLHSTAEFEGTGIGLAIVQRIIHRHGGRVSAMGEPGRGATFSFTLSRRKSGP